MKKQYVLFIVLNNVKKTGKIIKGLKGLGIKGFTVMNTFGSQRYCSSDSKSSSYEPIVAGSSKSTMNHMKRKYNKTFFIVLDEVQLEPVMDEIEGILHMATDKPGQGIMFATPLLTSNGVRR